MKSAHILALVISGFVCALLAITIPVYITTTNATERMTACVKSGGAYIQVPERTTMECQR